MFMSISLPFAEHTRLPSEQSLDGIQSIAPGLYCLLEETLSWGKATRDKLDLPLHKQEMVQCLVLNVSTLAG